MKRQFMFGAMLSAVLVAGAAAQQPAQTTPQSRQGEKDKTVTLVGCLQGDKGATATGTTGDTTSRQQSKGEEHYILANATMSPASGTAGTGTGGRTGGTGTGTTGATGSMAGAKSYRLIATDSQDLDRWVNSRVEVIGTIVGENRASGDAPAAKETKPGQSEQAGMPLVRVTSARQIANSCSGE